MTYRLRTTMSAKVVVGCYVRDKRNKDSKIHFVVNEIDEQLDEYRCSSIGFNNQIKVVRRLRDLELVDDERTVKLIDEFNNFNPRKTVNRSPKRQLEKKSHRLSSLSAPSTRMKALMPDGVPRYIRCYDNGGVTADRYTVCFTGRYRHKSLGEYLYLTMSNDRSVESIRARSPSLSVSIPLAAARFVKALVKRSMFSVCPAAFERSKMPEYVRSAASAVRFAASPNSATFSFATLICIPASLAEDARTLSASERLLAN